MIPPDIARGPTPAHVTSLAASALIDPNAALWASLYPPPPPSWFAVLRARTNLSSLRSLADGLAGTLSWARPSTSALRWLVSSSLGLALGMGLGVSLRSSTVEAAKAVQVAQHLEPSVRKAALAPSTAAAQRPGAATITASAAVASDEAIGASADRPLQVPNSDAVSVSSEADAVRATAACRRCGKAKSTPRRKQAAAARRRAKQASARRLATTRAAKTARAADAMAATARAATTNAKAPHRR